VFLIYPVRNLLVKSIFGIFINIMKKEKPMVLLILSLLLISSCSKAQDLALNKSYTLSVLPNYEYSALASDKTSLTDGKYTKHGRFWTSPSTIGWKLREVTITIDLGKIESIGAVTFNTVRSIDVGISFPQNIFIFISKDDKNFQYIGDAADTPDNLPGHTKVKKFFLAGINIPVRYVTLSIIPQGLYLFCDEIEVLKGKKFSSSRMRVIPADSLKNVIESLKEPKNNRRNLLRAFGSFQNIQKGNKNIVKMQRQMSSITSRLSNQKILGNDLSIFKSEFEKEQSFYLRNKFNTPFIVEKYNPWDSLNEFHVPGKNSLNLNYQFLITSGSSQYGCFVVTNSNSIPQQFSFNVSCDSSFNNIQLFKVAYVPSMYYSLIPDPLIKVDNVSIDPGLSVMFIFKITGVNSGTGNSKITISSSQKKAELQIKAQVVNLHELNKNGNLNVNVWAYLSNVMLRSDISDVVKDLEEHHVNSIVIPPSIVPGLETTDFTNFISYLSNFKNIKNILLYMDYSSADRRKGSKNGEFMSFDWKNKFIHWYQTIKKMIYDNGFSNAEIYLYPYDEISEGNIEDLKSLISWTKQTIPGVKFYATLNTEISIDSILPLVDIAQILPALAIKLPLHNCQIWIYTGNTPSRALSPYAFYRLMAWSAFVNNYKGIGFWNYADERNGNKLNLISDQMPNFNGSYSVIYNGNDGAIISSRRWEAFQLGIEDYSILKSFARKFGIEKAKAFANEVLSNSSDLNKADLVRNAMVTQLTETN
jgi:hypothetical protein